MKQIITDMDLEIISLRTFIGSKDFSISKSFYTDLGFQEITLSASLSLFRRNEFSFYLKDAYVEDWLNNTMLFIEVKDVAECFEWLTSLQLHKNYPGVKLIPIKKNDWGDECFVLDPAGALLHFGQFR
ncbi:hypothetical protein RG47T_0516 [Mucilaginibacter polytrichastri]|uniref:VOC domain-containing protein n=2 Tax=Mucilaginibacter polytrichastri TaxID=1302689 RepID=A0A1Q5ZTJ3_9SPHI|nr:hypothetical protein RG47T_0516 [Mucilaginibacter polytrichastri]